MFAFSVRDGAVGAYLPLFFARSHPEAVRSFMSAVGDSSHQFAKHKSDYVLYCVGSFDDNSGMLESISPDRVMSALDVPL